MQKKNSSNSINPFKPRIRDKGEIKRFASQNKARLLISACDTEYLEKNFEYLMAYKQSKSEIPYLVLIFKDKSSDEDDLDKKIMKWKNRVNSTKIFIGIFSCDALAEVKKKLGESTYKMYRTNYIRCARYLMVKEIWEILGIESRGFTIKETCTYIMDFDNYVLGDFNHIVKARYGEKKAIFCWNSAMSTEKDFPNSLSCFSIMEQRMKFSLAHKVIKAGFAAISPNALTSTMLKMFEFYAIGPKSSNVHHKLFSFYYSDQVCLLNLLRDMKENDQGIYNKDIGWIDSNNSKIACLKNEGKPAIFMPKGHTRLNDIID